MLSICTAAFEHADKDQSGCLDSTEMGAVFEALGSSELSLAANEAAALMAAADPNEDGLVEYGEFCGMIYDILQVRGEKTNAYLDSF